MIGRRKFLALAAAAVCVACGVEGAPEATNAADIPPREPIVPWQVDPQTPQFAYPVVEEAARQPIRLQLEARTRSEAVESQLSIPSGAALDSNGRMYIADGRQNRILEFEADGHFLRSFGRSGSGPGEFRDLGPIAVAGERLAAIDTQRRRIAAWNILTGDLETDAALWLPRQIWDISGTADGKLVGSYVQAAPDDPETMYRHVVGLTTKGFRERVFASLPAWPRPRGRFPNQFGQTSNYYARPVGTPGAWYAVSQRGHVYLTTGIDYVILSFDASGNQLWMLSVPWPREPVTAREIEVGKRHLREATGGWLTENQVDQIDWPDLSPALSRGYAAISNGGSLKVDGLGFLYVFPHIPTPWATDDRLRPVDVYDSDGNFLFGGTILNVNWQASQGETILALAEDAESHQWVAARYKMIWPREFQPVRQAASLQNR